MKAPLLALALLAPLTSPVQDHDDANADGNKLVQLTLIADRTPIQPGATFTLGLRCRIERRWHVYWGENSGDAGLPFKADITGPEGYEIGKVRFPWPARHEVEGDIVEYIHEGEMVLLADVKVPASAKPGDTARFDVAASWLICTDVCVPGKGSAELEVAIADKAVNANDAVFAEARGRLPRPWSEIGRAGANWSGDEAAPRLTIVVPQATGLEFFPYKSKTMDLVKRTLDVGKQGGTIGLEYEFEKKQDGDAPMVRGVLWVKTAKGETSYLLEKAFGK